LLACTDEAECSEYDKPYWQACRDEKKCVPPPAEKAALAMQIFAEPLQGDAREAESHESIYAVHALVAAAIVGAAISCFIANLRRPPRRGTPLLAEA